MADTSRGTPVGTKIRRTAQKRAEQARRNPRLRLACLRCQRRKIRCDGQLPACKSCRDAGVECADGESARLKDLPRAYITTLKERIAWLESIVRSKCPEVDLDQGPMPDAGDFDSMPQEESEPATRRDSAVRLDVSTSPVPADTTAQGPSVQPRPTVMPVGSGGNPLLSHEIGLVSLGANQDPRYIGPSSGYFLARVMLTKPPRRGYDVPKAEREASFPSELVEALQGPAVLPSLDMAKQLSDAYFEFIHPQYPALHQPTLRRMIMQVYEQQDADPVASFQVYMVLAIGATVLSGRLKARIPGESFCLAAMQFFHRLNIENSIQGLQCLILLLIFSIHNPAARLNVWYLNYQCIAALIDLGLQRNITTQSGITTLEQEMRTRIFWIVFMLDRTICTMMGRPVGFRDEACELRLPQGLDDAALSDPQPSSSTSTIMAYSVHLFRLARLNSEIKYVANSVIQGAPKYAYPTVININDWQSGMRQQLEQWAAQIPISDGSVSATHMNLVCQLKYHSVRMLLLRPSPAIPKPSAEALSHCFASSQAGIRIFYELYKKNLLIQSWLTFHVLVMSILTMFYCIKASPDIARQVEVIGLMDDLSVGLSMLSATGEHWSGAKRIRDILDNLGRSTIQWLREANNGRRNEDADNGRTPGMPTFSVGSGVNDQITMGSSDQTSMAYAPIGPAVNDATPCLTQSIEDGFFPFGSFTDFIEVGDVENLDVIVQDLFQGLIPDYSAFS